MTVVAEDLNVNATGKNHIREVDVEEEVAAAEAEDSEVMVETTGKIVETSVSGTIAHSKTNLAGQIVLAN